MGTWLTPSMSRRPASSPQNVSSASTRLSAEPVEASAEVVIDGRGDVAIGDDRRCHAASADDGRQRSPPS